jgi:hypothetical protein
MPSPRLGLLGRRPRFAGALAHEVSGGLTKKPCRVPVLVLMISPPSGFWVARVMFAIAIAFAFTNVACPLACSRITGLLAETLSSDSCVGNPSIAGRGGAIHFS